MNVFVIGLLDGFWCGNSGFLNVLTNGMSKDISVATTRAEGVIFLIPFFNERNIFDGL